MSVFRIDQGADYLAIERDGVTVLRGFNTGTEYVAPANRVEQTGRFRKQPGGIWGARAVLTLDTGEGIVTFRGVMVQ